MTKPSPSPQPPLTLSIDDLTQTRAHQTRLSMRWPSDPETTARLRKVIRLDAGNSTPHWRRLLRWLKRIS